MSGFGFDPERCHSLLELKCALTVANLPHAIEPFNEREVMVRMSGRRDYIMPREQHILDFLEKNYQLTVKA